MCDRFIRRSRGLKGKILVSSISPFTAIFSNLSWTDFSFHAILNLLGYAFDLGKCEILSFAKDTNLGVEITAFSFY